VARGKEFEWKVALILFGVLFLGVSDAQLVPPLLSLIAQDLGSTPGHAGIIVTAYSLSAAMFALFAGPLSDAIGRKRVLAAGLALFAAASFSTYHVSTLNALVIVRSITGFAAGTLSTCALSLAGDHYAYQQRGRAMGVLSMGYFMAFVAGAPAAALMAPRFGWQSVFTALALLAAFMLALVVLRLPHDAGRPRRPWSFPALGVHLRKPDRLAGMAAAFLTSGGLVGYLTYIGAWLRNEHQATFDQIAFVFMLSGIAAVAASPVSGWLSDRLGKRAVIVWTNILLAPLFILIAGLEWGWSLWAGIALMAIGASARQPPLHALTTEIVGPEIRGEYTAVRNAASQIGIATAAAASAWAFDSAGLVGVGIIAAGMTLAVPPCLLFMGRKL
jgi:predicted MFS family arabinose efflux permease